MGIRTHHFSLGGGGRLHDGVLGVLVLRGGELSVVQLPGVDVEASVLGLHVAGEHLVILQEKGYQCLHCMQSISYLQ